MDGTAVLTLLAVLMGPDITTHLPLLLADFLIHLLLLTVSLIHHLLLQSHKFLETSRGTKTARDPQHLKTTDPLLLTLRPNLPQHPADTMAILINEAVDAAVVVAVHGDARAGLALPLT